MLFTIMKTNCCMLLSCLPSGLQSSFQAIWSFLLYKISLILSSTLSPLGLLSVWDCLPRWVASPGQIWNRCESWRGNRCVKLVEKSWLSRVVQFFFLFALLRDCSLCWDRWNGIVTPTLDASLLSSSRAGADLGRFPSTHNYHWKLACRQCS